MARGHAGRCAILTGGSNGIGAALAVRLAEDGVRVVILDKAEGTATVERARQAGGQAEWVQCDITDPRQVESVTAAARDRHGPIEILVHCAGIYPMQAFETITFEDWKRVFAVNVESFFHLLKALIPGMKERRWGRVVSIASNTFHAGVPQLGHYVASKGALIGLTRSLATELGEHGITLNCVSPSLVRTRQTETTLPQEFFDEVIKLQAVKRTSMPADYAGAVSFLTSEDCAFMTGQTLVVDGGWTHV